MSPPAAPGSYPGNPSLPVEVREKILATFRHALNLFSSGNVSDCVIGCEFILKMDPRFTPPSGCGRRPGTARPTWTSASSRPS